MTNRLVIEGDTIECDYCKQTIGKIEYRNARYYASDSVLKHYNELCEVLHNEDEAIEEWRRERMFDGTAGE